jgi:hypothetical protein
MWDDEMSMNFDNFEENACLFRKQKKRKKVRWRA